MKNCLPEVGKGLFYMDGPQNYMDRSLPAAGEAWIHMKIEADYMYSCRGSETGRRDDREKLRRDATGRPGTCRGGW